MCGLEPRVARFFPLHLSPHSPHSWTRSLSGYSFLNSVYERRVEVERRVGEWGGGYSQPLDAKF